MGLATGLGLSLLVILFIRGEIPYNSVRDPLPQTIHSVTLTGTYDFAGEILPIHTFDVAERLEREILANTYQHSSTLLHLKLSARYFPYIEKIFVQEGIPADLKYLAVAESSLRYGVSSAGAKGIWQFLNETGKEFGLEVTDFVDERNHFEMSTVAAVKYLKSLKIRFGSWTLAAAAYNMGPTALQKAMEEQRERDYYRLNLSEETNRYVFRIVAAKEVMKNPEKYGFYLKDSEKYNDLKKHKTVRIDSSISNLGDFAHQFDISYRDLKLWNPWLMKSQLPNKARKTYSIKIPE
jgi:hypothetical protein